MRLFFGLPVDDTVREQVGGLEERLKSVGGKVNWVSPANFHFTLCFLGEVPEARVEETAAAAEGSWEGLEPCRLVLRGVGAFPTTSSPRVIWVGLVEGRDFVSRLEAALSERLRSRLGLAGESRPFVPHLTIGRVKMPRRVPALESALAELAAAEGGSFVPRHFALYQSLLRPSGSVYRPVRTYGS